MYIVELQTVSFEQYEMSFIGSSTIVGSYVGG